MAASFWKGNRRKFPIVNTVLSVGFTITLISIVFWVSSIEARVQGNSAIQKSVLDSNIKFSQECKSIKNDVKFIRDQLTIIQTVLISTNE